MTATFHTTGIANTRMTFGPGQKGADGSEEIIESDLGTELQETPEENGPDRPTIKNPGSPDDMSNG